MTKNKIDCKTLTHTFGSDHQALRIQILRLTCPEIPIRNTANLKTLDKATYQVVVENKLSTVSTTFDNDKQATTGINQLTDVLADAFYAQGKMVQDDKHKQKPWWDEETLRPLMKTRKCARRWMICSGLPEAEENYWEWQRFVKQEIEKLKQKHWRKFLANANNNLTFKALSYTAPTLSGSVAPLYREDRSVATDKEEQTELLFFGTSVALTECNLTDIPRDLLPPAKGPIPIIPPHKVGTIISSLPTKKAKGSDNYGMPQGPW